MKVEATHLADVLIIEPRVFIDDRGFFVESFNQAAFAAATGVERSWVQDNQSVSRRGVLRGVHFQNPRPQGKLVRCVSGAVFDVAVDLRESSPTFARWVGVDLTARNHRQLWVPEGFGHGFYTLTDEATVLYKMTDYHVPDADRSLRWDDPDIGIDWPLDGEPIVSHKDQVAPLLGEAGLFE